MKRKRHSPEQIIRKLREAEGLLSAGKTSFPIGAVAGPNSASSSKPSDVSSPADSE